MSFKVFPVVLVDWKLFALFRFAEVLAVLAFAVRMKSKVLVWVVNVMLTTTSHVFSKICLIYDM